LCLIEVSKEGLSEEELKAILHIDSGTWSPIFFAMASFILDRAGLYRYTTYTMYLKCLHPFIPSFFRLSFYYFSFFNCFFFFYYFSLILPLPSLYLFPHFAFCISFFPVFYHLIISVSLLLFNFLSRVMLVP
jgi:hypothetical protein